MLSPYIIAGPCAAESVQQLLSTAEGIAHCQSQYPHYTYIFRAGIWKPRTSPDTFQGIGLEGLKWLQEVKSVFHLDVATEVATAEQTNQALSEGVDYLWIGARTAANPIAVQTIADCIVQFRKQLATCNLKGIFIKNPVNEDVALWLGNSVRLEQTGVPVMAVHRGCNHRPCWQMAYQLMAQRSDIPLIMDPSHMSGKASAVKELCLKASQLGYQGWMIETHINPKKALSDAEQQISPSQLANILETLESCIENVDERELNWLRCMIDEVDDQLWESLNQRMQICRRIGVWKKDRKIPVVQPARFQQIVQKRIEWAKIKDIDPHAVETIMGAIHTESVRVQS